MDLPSLVTELHLRGFDVDKVDSALRCLVHVHAVQDHTPADTGGILAEDILDTYELSVVQAATELFLDRSRTQGRDVFRVRWGCEAAAEAMEDQLWSHASERWEEFVAQLDGRYLGLIMPTADGGRVINDWKLGKELRWFSVEVPRQGWKMLGIMDDISAVAWKLDLAFGYRLFDAEGLKTPRVLLHEKAYGLLKNRRVEPPVNLIQSIRLWRFFSEYDVNASDFVALMRDCDLGLDEVVGQVTKFFSDNLTSQYRDGQYPPYFVNDKKRKEFKQAVRDLLQPMDAWLLRRDVAQALPQTSPEVPGPNPKGAPRQSSKSRTRV